METPPPDPAALLAIWMDWEKGEITPGKTLSDLKRASMRLLLEAAVATAAADAAAVAAAEAYDYGDPDPVTADPAGAGA